MLMAHAWQGYFHNDVVRFATPGWQVSRVVGPFAKDGLYGFGGVSFRSEGPGLFSRFATTKSGSFGRSVSRFTVDYLEHADGGKMEIKLDGVLREVVDTSAAVTRTSPASLLRPCFEGLDREQFLVCGLDAKHRIIGINIVSIGSLTLAIVHPREVFKPLILMNAAA